MKQRRTERGVKQRRTEKKEAGQLKRVKERTTLLKVKHLSPNKTYVYRVAGIWCKC